MLKSSLFILQTMDFFMTEQSVDGELCIVELFDIPGQAGQAGQDIYSNVRAKLYPLADIFLLCFDVMSPDSFLNLRRKFVPEIEGLSPGTPFILVGTKSDLGEKFATKELGSRLARTVGAISYLECSSLTNHGVSNVFQEVEYNVIYQLDHSSFPSIQ